MVAIVTREVGATAKGSPLTNAEVDNNFINLEEGKIERFVACKNETGSTAAIGTVVYITGSTGTNPIFALAAASSEATSSKTFGIVWPAAINNNAVGNVITQGIITGLNTSAYSAGAALWLSTTAGSLTATKPTQPNHSVFIGYVVRSHATEGSIQVKILNGYELDELHDVLITSPAYRQFLYRNASNTLWINGFIQDVIGAKIGSAPDEIPLNQYLGDLAYQSSKSVSIDLLNATTISSTNGATIQGLTIGRGAGAVTTNTAVGASALAANTTGSSSVAVGNGALIAQTSGDRNVAVGESALSTNQTGVRNTAIGHVALAANTASYNTALGGYALFSNTTASNNTAVGYQAGYSNTTGNVNVFMGRQAGYGNTTGAANNAFGDLALYTNSTGGYNNAFGRQALYFNTTGDYNTALGSSALYSNTTASNNTAVGYQAGYSVAVNGASVFVGQQAGYYTTASEVTAVGSAALFSNTTGTANVALGRLALFSNTTASNNTAVGYQAGYSNTTGSLNTAVGQQALFSNVGTSNHVAIGSGALYSHTTSADGGSNIAIGQGAAYSNVSGQGLIAIGQGALYANTSGQANTAVGGYSGSANAAMRFNTTGSYNTAIGVSALNSNTTASYNTAVGYQALYSNVTSTQNTAVGYQALYSNANNQNSAFGFQALYSNTSGYYNVAAGEMALFANTSGQNNSAFGFNALKSNTTANGNTAFGAYALYSNNTGGENTAVGQNALYSVAVSSGYQAFCNTGVGRNAGYSLTTGNGNTFIGRVAGFSVTTGSKNTFIGGGDGNTNYSAGYFVTTGSSNTILGAYSGNQGGLDIRTSSNYIVLSDGDGNPRGIFNSLGNLWLGATAAVDASGERLLVAYDYPTTGATWKNSSTNNTYAITWNNPNGIVGSVNTDGNEVKYHTAGSGSGGAGAGATLLRAGVQFPATQSASSDANTLDDYEEGSWSPVLASSGGGTVGLGTAARYVKIGRVVMVTLENFAVDTTGLSAGNLTITGFPFSESGSASPAIAYFQLAGATSASNGALVAYMSGSSTAQLYKSESTSSAIANLTKADINNSISLRFNGYYFTST